jgi:hypothetical protein
MERKETYNGYCYKDINAFNNKKGVCYIAELSDQEYTYQDFLSMCNGNETLARNIFEDIDWQHPETRLDELGYQIPKSYLEQ